MEVIRSRQNELIKRFSLLASDGKARREAGVYVCAGTKLLGEAVSSGVTIDCVLTAEELPGLPCRLVTPDILRAVTPLQNSEGPVFTVKISSVPRPSKMNRVIVMENVQDPGNVGTVLRTADAFGMDAVVLCGACADPYQPKTVRASMGAIFRQCVLKTDTAGLRALLGDLRLYGAALHKDAVDIRSLPKDGIAVAVGNEGQGLSEELLSLCDGTALIPMRPQAESLNAGVAAAVAMWEMVRSWHD